MQYHNAATRGQCCSLQLCSPKLDWQSVTTTSAAAATGLHFVWLMAGQSNLPVFELLNSFSFHAHSHTYAYARSQIHSSHWFTVYCKRDIYKRPLGCPLFVCLHLSLGSGSLSSHLSRLTHWATVKTQLYVHLYLELSCENKNEIQALLIQGLRGIKCSTLKSLH